MHYVLFKLLLILLLTSLFTKVLSCSGTHGNCLWPLVSAIAFAFYAYIYRRKKTRSERIQIQKIYDAYKEPSGHGMPAASNRIFCPLERGTVPRLAQRFQDEISFRIYHAVFLICDPKLKMRYIHEWSGIRFSHTHGSVHVNLLA